MVLVRDNEYEWWFMTDGRLMAPISAAFLNAAILLDCWQKKVAALHAFADAACISAQLPPNTPN